jgi:hypothetical protein
MPAAPGLDTFNEAMFQQGAWMNHWRYMLVCLGFVALAVVLVAFGASALAFAPALGCAAMMGMMVWMMVRGHKSG